MRVKITFSSNMNSRDMDKAWGIIHINHGLIENNETLVRIRYATPKEMKPLIHGQYGDLKIMVHFANNTLTYSVKKLRKE